MTAEERLVAYINVPLTSHTLEMGGLRLHAMVAGSGPTVLLLHGLNIGWGEWYAMLPTLVKTYRVVALDFPGSGDSSKIDFISSDVPKLFVRAAETALETLAPDGAIVVGHSLGAWVALKLAITHHPLVRGVVAISAPGLSPKLPARFWPLAIRPLAKLLAAKAVPPTTENMKNFLGDVMVNRAMLIEECVAYVTEAIVRPPITHPFHLIHRMIRPFRVREEFMFSAGEIASVRRPMAIIHGAEDPLIPLRSVQPAFARFPNAHVAVLADTGHVPPIERPGEVIEELERLMTKIAS